MKLKVILRASMAVAASAALVALFSFKGVSAGTPGNIQRVSLDSSGNQANNTSYPGQISGDGRYVVFKSFANNLVSGDTNNKYDIFVRDTLNNTTTRVSVSSSGTEANDDSVHFAISYDGRHVAFSSNATNLVTGDTNGMQDVFIRDLQSNTTSLVSSSSAGVLANDNSLSPAISADGRYVAFTSTATNLVSGISSPNYKSLLYVKDMQSGAIRWIDKNTSGGVPSYGINGAPSLSCDGGTVVFMSYANDLVSGDTNGQVDIFVQSLVGDSNYRINATAGENGSSDNPVISCNGSEVIFNSGATNLVSGDTNGYSDTFVYHRLGATVERVSIATNGDQLNSYVTATRQAISGNGRYVAFTTNATNIPRSGYTYATSTPNVFVRDLKTGVTQLVTVSYNSSFSAQTCGEVSMSEDGTKVAFWSGYAYLVANDTNGAPDMFTADTGF